MYDGEISVYDWLNFFESKSNHWIFRYWRSNKGKFFERFMIVGNKELFIVADKQKGCTYDFKKPNLGFNIRFNLEGV